MILDQTQILYAMSYTGSLNLSYISLNTRRLVVSELFLTKIYVQSLYFFWKLINSKIHMKYVTHPICFKPHILSDKNIHFLGSQCHSQMFSIHWDIGLWILCTKSMGKFHSSCEMGALALLWPNFGGGMQIGPCAVICICGRMHNLFCASISP